MKLTVCWQIKSELCGTNSVFQFPLLKNVFGVFAVVISAPIVAGTSLSFTFVLSEGIVVKSGEPNTLVVKYFFPKSGHFVWTDPERVQVFCLLDQPL
ncbi:hypothetical protein B9G49_07720 [Halorubrum sp. SD683]|nr:hypothetical protein B9G49_07720 [Halorubrum sp. SD683]